MVRYGELLRLRVQNGKVLFFTSSNLCMEENEDQAIKPHIA